MKTSLASLVKLTTCTAILLSTAAFVSAADKKADPTGTWTWSAPGRGGAGGGGGGQPRTITAKLKAEGEKVTGTVSGGGRPGGQARETDIEDGKLKGDEISFKVTREFNNNKFTQKYNGKIDGDTIKGKMEFERNGEPVSRDWEAKRGEKKDSEKKEDK